MDLIEYSLEAHPSRRAIRVNPGKTDCETDGSVRRELGANRNGVFQYLLSIPTKSGHAPG